MALSSFFVILAHTRNAVDGGLGDRPGKEDSEQRLDDGRPQGVPASTTEIVRIMSVSVNKREQTAA